MRSVSSAQHAPVKDLSPQRDAALPIEIDQGMAYELVLSLRMWADEEDPASYEEGPAWFQRVRSAAPPALLSDIQQFAGGHELLFGHLLGLVRETSAPRDVPSFLEHVRSTSAADLRRHLLGYHLLTFRGSVSRSVIARAADGDEIAQRALREGSDDVCRAAYDHALSVDPDESKELVHSILHRWDEAILEPEADELEPVLVADAAAKRRLAATVPLDRLLDLLAPGIRYSPEPGIDRVLFVPSVVARPWVVMCEYDGTKMFCYPASDGAESDRETPPASLVGLYRALGDESRLRLLRRLSGGSATLQELADHVGLAKSTVHAHLLALRTSGLIRVRLSDKRYSLQTRAVDDARELLSTYLGEDRP